ncbi:MAG: hypothetical protein IID36_10170 [Planctomycetes bacterium]|nr:hypothetical protein [Planctomycetota bacterium]
MLIALPTCANLPDWEVDDAPLHSAFADRGIDIRRPVWDDPDVDWSGFRACLIRTTWDYQEKRDAFVVWAKRVARKTPLFNPYEIIRWNTHKSYLRDLERVGVPVTPTVWLGVGEQVDVGQVLRDRGWDRAFLKPAVGATSRETLRFDATSSGLASAEAHLHRMLPHEAMLLQPYLSAVETRGELSVVFIDGTFSHAVRKIPVPGDYRVQNDFGASDEPVTLTDDELALAYRCIAAIGARSSGRLLYARTDFLFDDEGAPRLSELELVEPSLYFRHAPLAAKRLADALCRRLADS